MTIGCAKKNCKIGGFSGSSRDKFTPFGIGNAIGVIVSETLNKKLK